MSLITWLPLISDTKNRGLSNPTLTTTGTITFNNGKLGKALTFNNTAITLKPAPLNTSTKEFSFAFWFKPSNTTGAMCIYNGRTEVGAAISIFRMTTNTFRFDDGVQHVFSYQTVANEWHHFVFTRDESNIKLYVDGVLNQTVTSSSFTCATASASIGLSSVSNATPNANPIIGQVNDYRIYDHVLSVKEIKELSKGLMTHLKLDWGANPNMIKNSYTWMNKNLGSPNAPSTTRIYTRSMIETEKAPCHWVYKCQIENAGTSSQGGCGCFYGVGAQGLALTDLVEGDTYTYSFWAKSDSGLSSGLDSAAIVETQTRVSYSGFGALDSNWRKHVVTFKWTKTTKLTACFYVTVPASSTIDFQVCGIKLEKGDKATPYVPHVSETAFTEHGYATLYKDDASGYNHTTTVTGTNLSPATDSPRGTGTNINKSGKITVVDVLPNGEVFPVFTINAWVRYTVGATQSLWQDLLGIAAKNSADSSSLLRLEFSNTTSGNIAWYGPMANSGGLLGTNIGNTGEWCMISLVSDGTKFIGYKNAAQYGTYTPSTNDYKGWKTAGAIYIGDSNVYYDVADVRVYSTVLSVDDIKELYQIPAQIDKTGKMYCGSLIEG